MDAFLTKKRPRSVEKQRISGVRRDSSISPPPKRNVQNHGPLKGAETIDLTEDSDNERLMGLTKAEEKATSIESTEHDAKKTSSKMIPSPIQLNYVQDLPASSNKDTIKLSDILGDPMMKECWLFNYLFDIDFLMQQFDSDIRDTVQIRVVHGSWKAEDSNGIGIIDGARRYPNIQIVKAYMAEAFGTHHSKMIVLFRHDDLAQVIILTANFIERDWSMSQAFWRTPLLPLLQQDISSPPSLPPLGSGPRFKHDLQAYFRGYGPSKLQDLITRLQQHDFGTVRGALVASVPGHQILQSLDPENETLWGWPGLKSILSRIPSASATSSSTNPSQPHIVAQISSVASVGEKWLTSTFFPTLSTSSSRSLKTSKQASSSTKPKISVVFPTADSIRRSVTGYAAGASIHMKISSPPQAKQLAFLHPLLHHWSGDQKPTKTSFFSSGVGRIREAGRQRAAPHIKTYIRFSDMEMKSIDWAMMTSANLSTQAWGAAVTGGGEVRICSFEIGVIVWPALYDQEGKPGQTKMVPTFKRDCPSPATGDGGAGGEGEGRVVGWRMPYDLPLVPYAKGEKPWCASEPDGEKDWMGRVWPGYEK